MRDVVTPEAAAALAAQNLRPLLLGEFYFDSGITYVCNASQNFDWNGNTYMGAAKVGRIDPVEEGSEVKMYGISLTLSGIPLERMAIALNEKYQGRKCIIRLALLNADYQIIADPVVIFRGRIDQQKIKLGKVGSITITVESRLADWDRARVGRFNNEDHQARVPGDRFFEYVPQMVERALNWGVPGSVDNASSVSAAQLAAVAGLVHFL
jgi:hypothetical protein